MTFPRKKTKIKKQTAREKFVTSFREQFDDSFFTPGDLYEIVDKIKIRTYWSSNSINTANKTINGKFPVKAYTSKKVVSAPSPSLSLSKKSAKYTFFSWNAVAERGGIIGTGIDLYQCMVEVGVDEPLMYVGVGDVQGSRYHVFLKDSTLIFTVGMLNTLLKGNWKKYL